MFKKKEKEIIENWQSKENPVVSVCCTAYNHVNYISDAIDGFLIQETDFPFEIIIRDDCSTDQTAKIIKKYVDEYPNIIKPIYETENQFSKGVKPMPVLYKKAVGKYFALCEGDDFWVDPLKLKKQVDFLESNCEYIGCYHNSRIINEDGMIINDSLICDPKDYLEMDLLSANAFITIHSVMFRNIIEFTDEFEEIPFGDVMLWHLLGYYGKVKYLNNIQKATYRKHKGGIWSGLDDYTKFEKGMVSKYIIKNKLLSNFIDTTDINFGIRQYVLKNLTLSLINNEYSLYKLLLLKLIEDYNFRKKNIAILIFNSIYRSEKYKMKQFLHKIIKSRYD